MIVRPSTSVIAFVLACLASACSNGSQCNNLCAGSQPATLDLSCAPSAVTSADLTGPCKPPADASLVVSGLGFSCPLAAQIPFVDCKQVSFFSDATGDCHVSLTFATGFMYSADVHFATSAPTCGCPAEQGLFPSPAVLTVNDPDVTCGGDAHGDF